MKKIMLFGFFLLFCMVNTAHANWQGELYVSKIRYWSTTDVYYASFEGEAYEGQQYEVPSNLREIIYHAYINKTLIDVYLAGGAVLAVEVMKNSTRIISEDMGSALSLAWGLLLITIFFWGVGRG